MTTNRIGAASLAALTLALGLALSPTTAQAYARHTVTTCEPFQPYHGVTHQRCTVEHYNNGVLMFTSVYYIDENGMWYRTAD
jgi:hypothetical protein